jgi:hypothetical protein
MVTFREAPKVGMPQDLSAQDAPIKAFGDGV